MVRQTSIRSSLPRVTLPAPGPAHLLGPYLGGVRGLGQPAPLEFLDVFPDGVEVVDGGAVLGQGLGQLRLLRQGYGGTGEGQKRGPATW